MKKVIFIILISFSIVLLSSKEIPNWVKYYQEKGTIENQTEFYFGVGESGISQKEADKIALVEFGKSIETKVQSEEKDYFREKDGKVSEKVSQKIKVNSKVGLKGVSITGRFFVDEKYFSIIKFEKQEYNEILREEVKRDLERQRIDLAKKIEKNKISEGKKQETIRKKIEDDNIKQKVSQMKESFMTRLRNKYPDFFDSPPPYKAISFRNGELIPHKKQINIKAGLNPISIEELFLAYQVWLFEFSSTSSFFENKFSQQEVQMKYQILPYSGKFYKFSAAFGFTGYQTDLLNSSFIDTKNMSVTPFLAGNITLPNLYFSFASAYIDLNKASVAINNYLFYKQLKDKISVILEVNSYFDDKFTNRFGDTIVFQPAITFKTTENLATTFSYEDNEIWKIGVEVGF